MNRSMTDVAYELLGEYKKPLPFVKLWQEVCNTMQLNETQASNKIANFYSTLMLDTRFAALEDNVWDLRSRRTYNETHPDTSSLIIDEDVDEDEIDDEALYDDEKSDKAASDSAEDNFD